MRKALVLCVVGAACTGQVHKPAGLGGGDGWVDDDVAAGDDGDETTGEEPSPGGDPASGGGDPSTGGGDPSPGGGDPSTGGGDPSTGGGDPSPGGGDPSPGGGDPSPGECPALTVDPDADIGGFISHLYTWRDANCATRTAALVRNDRSDPKGRKGGYMRRMTYQTPSGTRVCDSGHDYHPGFGFAVNHYGSTASISHSYTGTGGSVFVGRHHAIHRYNWTYKIHNQNVGVTIEWMFATGRHNPLWAITYDTSAASSGQVQADTRSPYGDFNWDGGLGVNVDGVGWGDKYRFTSLGNGPVTMNSGWDYKTPNIVPYVVEWANAADAEMGMVQTQTQDQHAAGGYWFYSAWNTRDDNGPMPDDWNWTYQLNQYELPFTTGTKRIAWGMNYGAVGMPNYNIYGDTATASGYPYQSYSVFIVLDRHSLSPVARQRDEIEAVQKTKLTASLGTVATSGPAGIARTDTTTYAPKGWNHVYATWELQSAASGVEVDIDTTTATLHDPMFVLRGWPGDGEPTVWIDGDLLDADVDYFASYEQPASKLWLTVRGVFSGVSTLRVEP